MEALAFEASFQLAEQWWGWDFYASVAAYLREHLLPNTPSSGITSNIAKPVLPLVAVTKHIIFSCYYVSFGHAGLTAGFELCGGQV